MTSILDVVGYGFAAAVTFVCVRHIATGGLKKDFEIFQNRTRADYFEVILGGLVCIAFLVGIGAASDHGPAFFRWSWLMLLDSKHAKGGNQMLAGATIPYFGLLFVPLLFLNLPQLARAEEEEFRDGTRDWRHAVPRSLEFGLMHMIVGVPLWVGLSLAVPGMWFTRQYFKGGVLRSTFAHAIYNMMLATGLFIYLLIVTFHKGGK